VSVNYSVPTETLFRLDLIWVVTMQIVTRQVKWQLATAVYLGVSLGVCTTVTLGVYSIINKFGHCIGMSDTS